MGISQESFRRAIAGMGVPDFLFGHGGQLDLQYRQIRHSMEERASDQINPGRTIDVDDEQIRLLFQQIRKEMETETANPRERILSVVEAPVKFEPASSDLDSASQEALDALARTLAQNNPREARHLAVVAWAGDEPSERQQWVLSAQRAAAVEARLRKALRDAGQGPWELVSWGAGGEASKMQGLGFKPTRSTVMVAVMAKED